jgi:hypothetical protein
MSTKYPNQSSRYCYGIVVRGNSGSSPAPNQDGGFKVHLPELYGENINFDLLPYGRPLGSARQGSIEENNQPPEDGTAVLCLLPTGRSTTGDVVVVGAWPDEVNKDGTTPGNSNLTKLFEGAVKHVTSKKSTPTKLKTTKRDGAEIREVEDGKMWSHELAKGIPSTLGLWPLAGLKYDTFKNVPTSIQHFSSIPTPAMLGSLPGMAMSLGKMISSLTSSGAFDRIKSALDNDMVMAIDSIAGLITEVETSSGSSFGTSSRVNPDVYFANAERLLTQAQNVGDLVYSFNQLQFNVELFGQDTLESVEVEVDTPFGSVDIMIDIDGQAESTINVSQLVTLAGDNVRGNTANANLSNAIVQAVSSQPKKKTQDTMKNILSFASMLQSASQAMSITGKPFFGDSAKMHFDMQQRLTTEAGKMSKQMMETLHTGTKEVQHLKEIRKMVRDGGKIFTKGFKR